MTLAVKNEQQIYLERAAKDPVWWCETVLGHKFWSKQSDVLRSLVDNKRTTVRAAESVGKSYVASDAVLWFLATHSPSTVITTAPSFRQVESILWRYIANGYAQCRIPFGGKLTGTKLDVADNWFAIGISTNQPERFQGFHNEAILLIVDEASGVSEEVFSAIENPLASGHARLLLIGNPTQQSGSFYNSFASEIYHPIHISAFDTPNFTKFGITREDIREDRWKEKVSGAYPYPLLVTPERVAERFAACGEKSYAYTVYVEGQFPEGGVNNLFRLSDVEDAVNRPMAEGQPHIVALDVARYGDDESVLGERKGDRVTHIGAWSHQDTQYTAGRVARYYRTNSPRIVRVDSIGVGGGVVDALKAEGVPVGEVNVGVPALDTEKFANRRAELYWLLAERFKVGEISIPDDPVLKAQLLDIRYTYNQKGQLIIESKEDARKRGSKSPDRADVLMMAFAPVGAGVARPLRTHSVMRVK